MKTKTLTKTDSAVSGLRMAVQNTNNENRGHIAVGVVILEDVAKERDEIAGRLKSLCYLASNVDNQTMKGRKIVARCARALLAEWFEENNLPVA